MFKRNGSALRQLLILQRNYLRLYLIETFLSGQVIIHYLLNYHSSNLSKPNTSPYKMCIEPQYKFNTRRHTRKITIPHTAKKKFFFMADCISKKPMELTLGFEPRTYGLQDRCSGQLS